MVGYAVGSILAGSFLARRPIHRKARASMLAWMLYLPGYGLIALATSLRSRSPGPSRQLSVRARP
jgi:hypothetical protein